jgi:hypothetical protein
MPRSANIFDKYFGVPQPSQTEVAEEYLNNLQTKAGGARTNEGREIYFWRRPISHKEVVVSSIVIVLFCAILVALLAHYPYYQCCFGQLTAAVRRWDFSEVPSSHPKEFWGFPYLSALVAIVTRLPDDFAILLVSSSMFVVANYLCCRLWGTTVAAWLMVVNYWWLDTATEGMTEPLFMALLLGSFIAFRKERWVFAAVLASAATIVRPAGIFALIAIGIVLLARRELRRLAITTAIGLATGILYVVPMMLIYGDPFANVAGYHASDWSSGLPVTIPLLPLIKGAAIYEAFRHWSKLHILIAVWVVLALAGTIKMATSKHFWHYAKVYPAEAIFAGAYALFLFSYDSPLWVWLYFPRFVIPLLPFLLLVFLDRLPRDRRILWGVALFNVAASVWPKVMGSG